MGFREQPAFYHHHGHHEQLGKYRIRQEQKLSQRLLKKTVKTQIGEVDVKIPRDRNGEYEPKIMGKYSRNADGMEEKSLPCTPAV